MKILKTLLPYIVIVIIVVIIRLFIATPVTVVGPSMQPNLVQGEVVILSKYKYYVSKIKRFDVVVIKALEETGKPIIKRVIGLPGENIEYKDNKLYINGNLIEEDFSHSKTYDFQTEMLGEEKVPSNCYLVLGDNRIDSKDSRSIGFIEKKDIVGKASIRIWPLSKLGFVK